MSADGDKTDSPVQVSASDRGGPQALPIDPSGVRGLDQVLGGGLTQRALVLILGPSGSGKTTLAAQLAMTAARDGRRALILTVLAESTGKLTEHLRTYTFFNADLLGAGLQILSIGHYLAAGLENLADELVKLVRAERAHLLVLDGFDGVRGLDQDPQASRRFLYTLGGTLSALGVTTLVTSVADPRDGSFAPVATIADVIVRLEYTLVSMRERRTLEIVKVRGAALLSGLHGLTLDVDGVHVYPRLEAQVAAARRSGGRTSLQRIDDRPVKRDASAAGEMAAFGVPALDTLLGGGLSGTTTLLAGELGMGKTLLGLYFALAGVARGERAILLSFRESTGELLRLADAFGLGQRMRGALAPGGGLTLVDVDVPPVELDPDVVAGELLELIERVGARRLIVDSSADLERAVAAVSGPGRVVDYLGALGVALRDRRVSALFIKEMGRTDASVMAADGSAPRADNLLVLRQDASNDLQQDELIILKTRFSAHTAGHHPFVIEAPKGFVFTPHDGTAEATR